MDIGDQVSPATMSAVHAVVDGIRVKYDDGSQAIFTRKGDLAPWVAPPPVVPTFYCATDGSDGSGDGSITKPFRTIAKLAGKLPANGVGLIEPDTYSELSVVTLTATHARLQSSIPGVPVTLQGRVWVKNTADHAMVADLVVNGTNRPATESQPTFMCNAKNFIGRRSGVTNGHTHIGWNMGGTTYGRADNFLLDHCWGDDCGRLTSEGRLHDHGIYVEHATGGIILGGHFNQNASRGVQLYPDAQQCEIIGVEGMGNRQGLLFGGGSEDYGPQASSQNTVSGCSFHDNTDADIDSWNGSTAKMLGNSVKGTYAPHLATQSGYTVLSLLSAPPVLV